MSEKASFESAWSVQFPHEKPPSIVCFSPLDVGAPGAAAAAASAGQDGEERVALAEAVRSSLDDQRRRLDDLHWQLERQKFVVDYLTGLQARLSPQTAAAAADGLPASRAGSSIRREHPLPPTAPKPKPRPQVPKRSDSGVGADDDGGGSGRRPPPPVPTTTVVAGGEPVESAAKGGASGIVKRSSVPHIPRPCDGLPPTAAAAAGVERSYSERPAAGRRNGAVAAAPAVEPAGFAGALLVPPAPGEPQPTTLLLPPPTTVQQRSGGGRQKKESDYVELWLSADRAERSVAPSASSGVAAAAATAGASSDRFAPDDSGGSASSLGSDGGSGGSMLARSASSRGAAVASSGGGGVSNLVLVQYDGDGMSLVRNDSQRAASPVASSPAATGGGGGDSDAEEEPTYVRLVYKALSTVKLAGLSSSSGNLSVESSGSDLEDAAGDATDIAETEQAAAINDDEPRSLEQQPRPEVRALADRPGHGPERSYSTEEEKLKMRQWVISSILESERYYVEDLDIIISYKKSLEAATKTSQPLISMHDIDAIFCNIAKIHEIHQIFLTELTPVVSKWSPASEVGAQFKYLSAHMPVYETYVGNWPNAIATLKRCCQENPRFQDLVSAIKCKSPPAERLPLEEILHKPINRIQRNTLVLHDLIQCTPLGHHDQELLRRSLTVAHEFLGHMAVSGIGSGSRLLVKNRLIVEYVGGKFRRLRHVFLFNDVLICTKPKIYRQKCQFEVKWHLPLSELLLSSTLDDKPIEWRQRSDKAEKAISQMKVRVRNLKAELRREMKDTREATVNTLGRVKKALMVAPATATMTDAASMAGNQKAERIKRKLEEEEAALALAEPRLRFCLESRAGSSYVFLLSSDYERNEWHESLVALVNKAPPLKMSLLEAQNVIDTCKDNVKLNSVGANILREAMDQDIVSGQLIVTIHKLQDMPAPAAGPQPTDAYCAIEVDSFGHFHVKAKTHIKSSGEWNEEFELDLEAATTLRFICYRHTTTGDVLIGKGALDLSKSWLRQGFDRKAISLTETSLIVTIQYRTADQTIQRIPSRVSTGVYGVKLSSTTRKEGTLVPTLVTSCIKEVEKRGFDEVGVYRVSGMTTDVQRIKKAFDKSSKAGCMLLEESDIHAVTGALKLYFRELPEALFTDELYPLLLDGLNLNDPEAKEKCMVSLINSLPDSNYHTVMAMLNHLIKICSYEAQNKMPFQNMATVFGPTLLKPAQRPAGDNTAVTFSSGASDALYQTGILFYYLTLVGKGTKFR